MLARPDIGFPLTAERPNVCLLRPDSPARLLNCSPEGLGLPVLGNSESTGTTPSATVGNPNLTPDLRFHPDGLLDRRQRDWATSKRFLRCTATGGRGLLTLPAGYCKTTSAVWVAQITARFGTQKIQHGATVMLTTDTLESLALLMPLTTKIRNHRAPSIP